MTASTVKTQRQPIVPLLPMPLLSTPEAAFAARQRQRDQSSHPELWNLLDAVKDPEVPVLSLWDLGVLCDVQQDAQAKVSVTLTPTYSGCPALETMQADVAAQLQQAGFEHYEIHIRLAPAWTTDALSPNGRRQLQAYGIAPPLQDSCALAAALTPEAGIECPHCHSDNTRRISEFGSTACKALFQCLDCAEPFDYFKQL